MATQYGYKIWEVDVFEGHKRKPLEWSKAKLGHGAAAQSLADSLEKISAEIIDVTRTEVLRYRHYEPKLDPNGDKEDTTPSIRLLASERTPNGFEFTFRFGRRGSHDSAMAAVPVNDASLSDKASSNQYRAFLYLPTGGTKAVLAVEARNQTCPGDELMRLLGVSSKDADKDRIETERLGWWRFDTARVSDDEQLKKFIREGHANGIRLEKQLISGSGQRGSKTIMVKQNGLFGNKPEIAKALGGVWFGFSPKELGLDVQLPPGNNVKQLASLLELKVSADQFEDGGIEWEGPDGSTQFVKPDSARDVFVYRIGKRGVSPATSALRSAVEKRIEALVPTRRWKLSL